MRQRRRTTTNFDVRRRMSTYVDVRLRTSLLEMTLKMIRGRRSLTIVHDRLRSSMIVVDHRRSSMIDDHRRRSPMIADDRIINRRSSTTFDERRRLSTFANDLSFVDDRRPSSTISSIRFPPPFESKKESNHEKRFVNDRSRSWIVSSMRLLLLFSIQ